MNGDDGREPALREVDGFDSFKCIPAKELNALPKSGLISYQRGHITMLNRKGMERTAGSTYGIPEAEYRRLIG